MASWLKAAEDLFEVVDRRAKSVVNDLSDEQSDSMSPASNGKGSHGKGTKSKSKAQKGLSKPSTIISDSTDTTRDKIGTPAAPVDVSTPTEKVNFIAENDGSASISTIQPYKEQKLTDSASPLLGMSLSNILAEDTGKHENDDAEVLAIDTDVEVATDFAPNSDAIRNYSDVKPESIVNRTNQEDHKTDISPKKVQDQLDEAQGLLKTAKSTGQSKEARLARVCAGLSSRLQEYKSENAQLEELLIADFAERELSKPCEARIKQLQKDLSESKREVMRVESNLAEALAAKNGEIEALLSSMEAVKRQAALSEGNLASMQASIESMMRNRELSETRMMQALREELASAK